MQPERVSLTAQPDRQSSFNGAFQPRWFFYGVPSAVVWSICLFAFWPGVMSYDSIEQWRQTATGQFNDWHPAFHTFNIWLITRLWRSPAAIAAAQILVLSVLVGRTATLFRRLGTPRPVVWVVLLLVALSPFNATMVITLWKDVPYSLALLTLTLLVLNVVTTNGRRLDHRRRWIALGCIAALIALYRHNGPFASFGTLAVMILCHPGRWRPLVGALLIALTAWLGVRGPVYRAIGVGDAGWMSYGPLIHQIAAHTAAGTPLSTGEQKYLDAIRPIKD